jgi:cytidylate kinase
MTALQRKLGRKGGLVAEGRDMGTVVFPNAEYKFFLTASLAVRARRRFQERIGRGETVSFEDIERELKKRDAQDRTRIVAPLRPAEDAIIIDTTNLDVDQVVKTILIELPESEIQDTSKMNTGS